ncbi:WAT1-related protein At1g09380-like isoform X2 [Solanum stenotomum]|uniref:WAT1-related protein At1g09380-like isoform X2 n=1 Tax=Solanum stenotomum TaxID=172797 RepID=UPI0020D11180|nr:WAT1-related protein At1g09380-like isoform X2 [Solanum stenotomum]
MGNELMVFMIMVIVQVAYAGMVIISKLVMDGGMNAFVQSAYRPIFATISIAPFAFFLERKTRPKMTRSILFQIFLCSIFGITANQNIYFIGLKNSTPTIVSAIDNLIPAFTFIIAVPLGIEKLGLRSIAGQTKFWGTIICVGGAMLLSLYHGKVVIGQLGFHWKYAENTSKDVNSANSNFFLGPFLLILSSLTYAIWLIIQGAMATSFTYFLSSWCIEKKGPLYVSMFNPLFLVISAFLSWILLREKLYLGVVVGSIIVVAGMYGFLWGKKMETNAEDIDVLELTKEKKQSTKLQADLELQLPQNHKDNNNNNMKQIIQSKTAL